MPRISFTPTTRGTYQKTISIPADQWGKPPTNPPTAVLQDNVILYAFTLNNDSLEYKFPIPDDYYGGDIDFSIIWTNDGGVDDNGKNAKWQFDYQTATEGDPVNGSHANSPKTVEDTYTSDTGWIEHHTGNMTIAADDFAGKLCILLKLSAVTPAGTALTCEPHLMGICFTYMAIWGRKP